MQSLPHRSFLRWKFCLFWQGCLRTAESPISLLCSLSPTSPLFIFSIYPSLLSPLSPPWYFSSKPSIIVHPSILSLIYSIYYVYLVYRDSLCRAKDPGKALKNSFAALKNSSIASRKVFVFLIHSIFIIYYIYLIYRDSLSWVKNRLAASKKSVVTFKNFFMVLKKSADMLEKIAKSRKKLGRCKKRQKCRSLKNMFKKTCFTAYFLYCWFTGD